MLSVPKGILQQTLESGNQVLLLLHVILSAFVFCTVTAPSTALAAFNVHGTTIQRALCLPVEHGKPSDYNRLSQEQRTIIRANLKLLIIDEVSMVSPITLMYIHMRLTEIMSTDEYFGHISIVFFADFLQLPPNPSYQSPIWKPSSGLEPLPLLIFLICHHEVTQTIPGIKQKSLSDVRVCPLDNRLKVDTASVMWHHWSVPIHHTLYLLIRSICMCT